MNLKYEPSSEPLRFCPWSEEPSRGGGGGRFVFHCHAVIRDSFASNLLENLAPGLIAWGPSKVEVDVVEGWELSSESVMHGPKSGANRSCGFRVVVSGIGVRAWMIVLFRWRV